MQAETRWRHSKHLSAIFLDSHRNVIEGGETAAGDYFENFIFIFLCKMPTAHIGTSRSSFVTSIMRRVLFMTPDIWIPYYCILLMFWMFVQLYEDNKVSWFQFACTQIKQQTSKKREVLVWNGRHTTSTVKTAGTHRTLWNTWLRWIGFLWFAVTWSDKVKSLDCFTVRNKLNCFPNLIFFNSDHTNIKA